MKKLIFLAVVLCVLAMYPLHSQSTFNSLLSLRVTPGLNIPLGTDGLLYSLGPGGLVSAELSMPFFPMLYASVDIGYNFVPLKTDITSMSLLSFGGGVGFDLNPIPLLSVRVFAKGGYYYGFLHNNADSGGYPFVQGGLGVFLLFSPRVGVGIDGSYRNFLGLYNDLTVNLGVVINIVPSKKGAADAGGIMEHKPGQGLDLLSVDLDNVFPVFFSYYDDNPVGKAVIKNFEKKPMANIEATFYVKQYMDNPKTCTVPTTLKPGEEAQIDLYGLFTNRILEISEGTKVSAQITIKYTYNDAVYKRERVETLRVNNRNALTWDDDRKAAAFVTAKDSQVLKFAKNTAGIVQENTGSAIDRNLSQAMGIFTALKNHGMTYVVDPSSPYAELVENKNATDFIQFPVQTLEYKAGDCDDLSILYAALLESIGIETAFITVPGHIFMAFALNLSKAEASSALSKPEDLIFMDGKTWVPVEITAINDGFLKAWQFGAKEWRENAANLSAAFFPIHKAWTVYEPVGFDIIRTDIAAPSAGAVAASYNKEYTAFVEREIFPMVEEINRKITETQDVKYINKLGVLYARYGFNDKAEAEFKKAVGQNEYVPALLNLGNVSYLKALYAEAIVFYRRAEKVRPNDASVLLGVARASHETADYAAAKTAFTRVKSLDAGLAEKFSYLDMSGQETGRAADQAQVKEAVVWEEE
ncbi:MAG: hypothetical protein E4H36_15375 [Spirochaetales bacterium]|nr:MAG: hypothetical protein E4H36_15375 [Spirochaetales bacterium]